MYFLMYAQSPAQVEGTKGFLPQPVKDLESPSSTRLEALVPSRDSRARTRSPSPRANEVIGLGGLRKLPKLCFRVKLGFQSSKSHFCKIVKLPWDLTLRTQQRNALGSPRDFSVLKTPVISLYESVQGL